MLFCYCVFSPFSIGITSLGEETANLSALCTFVRFAFVWFCLFTLPFGVWEGLRLVNVALAGLFVCAEVLRPSQPNRVMSCFLPFIYF